MSGFSRLQREMIERQIVCRGVRDARVLAAMGRVPRHEFVPGDFRHHAYEDRPLPIGHGQTISQPYMVAAMTEALLGSGTEQPEKVLEIGTGSGYQAAILAELFKRVYTVEIIRELSAGARQALVRLGYRNVHVRPANGQLGWPPHAPYDRVLVTAGAETMPHRLVEQLKEGGRIVVPVGRGGAQSLMLGVKQGGRLVQRRLFDCVFVPFVSGRSEKASGRG